jgi:hypothetical protein
MTAFVDVRTILNDYYSRDAGLAKNIESQIGPNDLRLATDLLRVFENKPEVGVVSLLRRRINSIVDPLRSEYVYVEMDSGIYLTTIGMLYRSLGTGISMPYMIKKLQEYIQLLYLDHSDATLEKNSYIKEEVMNAASKSGHLMLDFPGKYFDSILRFLRTKTWTFLLSEDWTKNELTELAEEYNNLYGMDDGDVALEIIRKEISSAYKSVQEVAGMDFSYDMAIKVLSDGYQPVRILSRKSPLDVPTEHTIYIRQSKRN